MASKGQARNEIGRWYGPAATAHRRWQQTLNQYQGLAGQQARLLEAWWVGPEHMLLALVAPREKSLAARALRASGVEYDMMFEASRRAVEGPHWPGKRRHGVPQQNPALYVCSGRAEGFAAAQNARAIGPEHLLLAVLYSSGRHTRLLGEMDVTSRKVLRELAALGVPVPQRQPLAADDTRWGEPVWIRAPWRDAWRLASIVQRLLPEGAPFGFNFSDTEVMLHTGEGIDLKPIIRRARRQQLREQRLDDAEPSPPRPR